MTCKAILIFMVKISYNKYNLGGDFMKKLKRFLFFVSLFAITYICFTNVSYAIYGNEDDIDIKSIECYSPI